MNLIRPKVEIITPIDREAVLKRIELCGRVCYKSEDKITPESAAKFIKGIVRSGHESVIEHASMTVKFTTERSTSHQIARHRICSLSQMSQRYCNYSDGKFGDELTFILPPWLDENDKSDALVTWLAAMKYAECTYMDLIEQGWKPEQARTVLPNATKTELMMTANMREWRHFLKLRTSKAADPQIRAVAIPLLHQFKEAIPELFFDIEEEM